jgi:hypothetical protein
VGEEDVAGEDDVVGAMRTSKRRRKEATGVKLEQLQQGGAVVVKLLALRDIASGEELTITYIKLSGGASARREELTSIRPQIEGISDGAGREGISDGVGGTAAAAAAAAAAALPTNQQQSKAVCACVRCRYETANDSGGAGVKGAMVETESLMHLANQAMECADLDTVVRIYTTVLRRLEEGEEEEEKDGGEGAGEGALARVQRLRAAAMHGIGAAYLGMGRWDHAHRAWKEGAAAVPTSTLLREQVAKDSAYYPSVHAAMDCAVDCAVDCAGGAGSGESYTPDASSHLGERVYISKQPLLSRAECRRVVRLTEEHVGTEVSQRLCVR